MSLRRDLSVLRRALPDGVLEANRQHVWLDPARVLAVASGSGAFSRVHDFFGIALKSAFALRGDDLAAPQMAERRGAQYVVQGSVRRAGDRVRIAVKLVDGRDGRTLWSDRFDDQLDDLLALQDRIAAKVAGQLSPSLRTAEILRAQTRPPNDRTAYETVLSAMPYFWTHNRGDNARAVDLFDEALARDPDYPLALAMKAWALAHQTAYLWTDDPAQVRHDSIAFANQAAVNAGDHVLTLIGVGAAISNASTEVGRARSFLEHALAINPNSAWGWMRMGYLDYYTDRPRRAREAFDRAISLSPLDPYLNNMVIGQGRRSSEPLTMMRPDVLLSGACRSGRAFGGHCGTGSRSIKISGAMRTHSEPPQNSRTLIPALHCY